MNLFRIKQLFILISFATVFGISPDAYSVSIGDLDTTFDSDGKVFIDLGGIERIMDIATQSDNKIIVVGYTNNDILVARLNENGSLDDTFGSDFNGDGTPDGYVTLNCDYDNTGDDYDDRANAVVIDSEDRITIAGVSNSFMEGTTNFITIARFTANGQIDTSFGNDYNHDGTKDGYLIEQVGLTSEAHDIILQSDGKILVGGTAVMNSDDDFVVARYLADGSGLDTSFNSVGYHGTDLGETNYPNEQGQSLALQSDGKILLTGNLDRTGLTPPNRGVAVVRYNTNGTLDTTFNSSGIVKLYTETTETNISDILGKAYRNAESYQVMINSSEKITILGHMYEYESSTSNTVISLDLLLARFTSDGTLDSTFGTSGLISTNVGDHTRGKYAVTDANDNIIATDFTANSKGKVLRYLNNGNLDSSFGGDGIIEMPSPPSFSFPGAVTLDSDDRIVIVRSYSSLSQSKDIEVARLFNSLSDDDADGYYAQNSEDCNDSDASINPAASEVCDGVDNDCDGEIDEGFTQNTYYKDGDGDGYGDPNDSQTACTTPSGYVENNSDCDDTDASIKPGATESCDGIDNDCDGSTDEDLTTTYYQDSDSDSYGNASVSQEACSQPTGYVTDNTDCNDSDDTTYPGATETCDGADNDCDGSTDEGLATQTYYQDSDNDSYGNASVSQEACSQPTGYVSDNSDCNDSNSDINPGATEVCDGADNDCDGSTDEDVKNTYYQDSDSDNYGNASVTTEACSAPTGYVTDNSDCHDSDGNINPGAAEVCDGKDNNCDGSTDEGLATQTYYQDSDSDGFGNPSASQTKCSQPAGYVTDNSDCNDSNANIKPGATEVCDSVDNDCDGSTDEGVTTTYYQDSDSDSYGNASASQEACSQPTGYVTDSSDCNDSNANIKPGATEVCDSIDNNCDGSVDEGVQTTYYQDSDSDGFGNASVTQTQCSQPTGYVTDNSDCSDSDASINPSATEVCGDNVDQDCSGSDLTCPEEETPEEDTSENTDSGDGGSDSGNEDTGDTSDNTGNDNNTDTGDDNTGSNDGSSDETSSNTDDSNTDQPTDDEDSGIDDPLIDNTEEPSGDSNLDEQQSAGETSADNTSSGGAAAGCSLVRNASTPTNSSPFFAGFMGLIFLGLIRIRAQKSVRQERLATF